MKKIRKTTSRSVKTWVVTHHISSVLKVVVGLMDGLGKEGELEALEGLERIRRPERDEGARIGDCLGVRVMQASKELCEPRNADFSHVGELDGSSLGGREEKVELDPRFLPSIPPPPLLLSTFTSPHLLSCLYLP